MGLVLALLDPPPKRGNLMIPVSSHHQDDITLLVGNPELNPYLATPGRYFSNEYHPSRV